VVGERGHQPAQDRPQVMEANAMESVDPAPAQSGGPYTGIAQTAADELSADMPAPGHTPDPQ
jgi:hypothetical protein